MTQEQNDQRPKITKKKDACNINIEIIIITMKFEAFEINVTVTNTNVTNSPPGLTANSFFNYSNETLTSYLQQNNEMNQLKQIFPTRCTVHAACV